MTDEKKTQTKELNEINDETIKEQSKENSISKDSINIDTEKTLIKEAALKSSTRGTTNGDDEDPLALVIQAAFQTDRRGKQETESEQRLFLGNDGGVNVIMESGELSCECTEHVIHGKNGFELPIKRIYDTSTAKSDCPSMAGFIRLLKTNMPDTAWIINQMGCSMNIRKVCEDCRKDYKITTNKVKETVRKMGGNIFCLGAGWRLSFPYIDKDEVLYLPGRGQYITEDMTTVLYTPYVSTGFDKCDAYEKHGGGTDFTFLVARKITQRDSRGAPTEWKTVFSQLVEKDGLTYIFNGDGDLTKIYDPSGANVITISYNSGLINEITEPFGSKMKFTYTTRDKYLCPVITKIALLNAAGTQTSTLEYTYKSLEGEWSGLNLLPLLEKAKDKCGRFTSYEYQKCSGIYAFYDKNMVSNYLNGIVFNLSSYCTTSGNFNEKVGHETPHLLKKVTTPNGFTQTIGYNKETAVLYPKEAGPYTPTKKERMMVKSITDKNGSLSKIRNYSYVQKLHANFQILVESCTMEENQRKTVCTYTERKDGDRYIPHINEKVLSIPGKNNTRVDISKTSYSWCNTSDRLTNEKTTKGKNSCETLYSYDNWGNVTTETVTKKYRENTSDEKIFIRTTKSKYYNTSSASITGFPSGVQSTPEQSVKGTRSLLVSREIIDTVKKGRTTCRIQKGFAYDAYGRCVWEGKYNKNHWGVTKYTFFTIDASNGFKGGLVKKRTAPSGQTYDFTYTISGSLLTEKVTARNVDIGTGLRRGVGTHIITTRVTDIQTGLVQSQIDANGSITTYTYDNLGRETSTVTPDGVTEQTLYNDTGRTITLRIKKAGTSSYSSRFKYEYDSKGNLIKKEQYNSVGTGDGNFSSFTESYTYNSDDNPVSFTDGRGNVTSYSYDLLGRVIKQTNPDGTENKREYDDSNSMMIVTDEDGHTYKEYPDFDDQIVKTERKPNNTELITTVCYYDVLGRTIDTTDGEGYSRDTYFSPFEKPEVQTGDAVTIREDGTDTIVYPRKEYEFTDDGSIKTEYDGYTKNRTASLANTPHKLRTKKYTYNKIGWLLSTEEGFQENETIPADKRKTNYEYDKNGNVTKEKHEDGTYRLYSYDSMNRMISLTDECGAVASFEYNHDGKLTKKTDSNGFVFEYFYDDFNRLVRAELPPVPGKTGKNIICIKYDQNGNVTEITEGDGKITVRDYDKLNRIISETVKKGSGSSELKTVWGWKYNRNGSVAQEIHGGIASDTNTAKTLYEYDVIGRLKKKTFPDVRTETYTLDHNDRVVQLTHADGSSRKTEYNELGFIIKETDEENFVTGHEYDVWGGEVYRSVRTSSDVTEASSWKTEYTVFGEVKAEESGDGRKWNYEYNNKGLVTKKTDPKGIVQTLCYDACGRMTSEVRAKGADSLSRSLVYDPMGFLKSGTDGGVITAFNLSGSTYNANAYGLVTGCKTTVGSKNLVSTFGYDEGKRISGITYPDSERAVFGYNGIGLLKSVGNANNATAYANNGIYDTAGHPTSMKAGNNLIRTEGWNKTKGLLENYNWGISGKSANTLSWNTRGNITVQVKNGFSYSYGYDKKDQLTEEKKGGSKLNTWTYDAMGNRKTEAKGSGSAKTVTCYTKSDLVKSDGTWNYNYDDNGNMTAKGNNATAKTNGGLFEGWTFNATSGEVWNYEYDLCNRLVKVKHSTAGTNNQAQVAECKYDFRDLMVCRITGNGSSAVSEYFAYDTEGKLIYTEKGTEKHEYIYVNGKLWCEVVTKGTSKNTYYHHTDHLGTTVCITNSSGSVVWQCEKDAFGTVKEKTNSSFTPNFTGKLLDDNTGLYYFNARWYEAEIGRFITEDPARDGRNWFVYCRNNPLSFIDSNGLNDKKAYEDTKNNYYLLQIKINLPGKDPVNDTLSSSKIEHNDNGRFTADGGHAFVTLAHINTSKSDIQSDSFGLYPAEKTGIMKGKTIRGIIKDDSKSYYDTKFSFFISKESYQKALAFAKAEQENPSDYNLYKKNCVDFAKLVAKKADINITDIPVGSNPSGLNKALRLNFVNKREQKNDKK